jgi:hypothetical protein
MARKAPQQRSPHSDLERRYPHLSAWVKDGDRWVEIGTDDFSRSFIRVLDIGGMIWEGETSYPTLDDALAAADAAIKQWLREQNMGGT